MLKNVHLKHYGKKKKVKMCLRSCKKYKTIKHLRFYKKKKKKTSEGSGTLCSLQQCSLMELRHNKCNDMIVENRMIISGITKLFRM